MYYKTAGFQYDLNKYSFFIFLNQKVHLKFILFVHGVQSQRYLVLSVNSSIDSYFAFIVTKNLYSDFFLA